MFNVELKPFNELESFTYVCFCNTHSPFEVFSLTYIALWNVDTCIKYCQNILLNINTISSEKGRYWETEVRSSRQEFFRSIIGNKYCQLFSSKWQAHFVFLSPCSPEKEKVPLVGDYHTCVHIWHVSQDRTVSHVGSSCLILHTTGYPHSSYFLLAPLI